jgi:soluble lytic murein transglycosylase
MRVVVIYKKSHLVIIGIILVLLTCALPVDADIYMYIDRSGVIHFTNVPTNSETDYRVFIKEKPRKNLGSDADVQYEHDFDPYIAEASKKHGVSFPLVKAIIKAESDFNPRAISRKGALGLMQIMPENLERLQISDPFDPWENIMGGTRYFKMMLQRFKGKLPLSLAAYNAGPTAVDRYQSIPPFKETENYIEKVMRYYYSYKY